MFLLRNLIAAALFLTVVPAMAADQSVNYSSWRRDQPPPYVRELPFPRSERTQAIWAEGPCWKQCQIACTNNLDVCLRSSIALGTPGQEQCLATTDSCDRGCQYQCRTYGGPLIPPIPQ